VRGVNGDVFLNKVSPYFTGENITYGNSNPFKTRTRVSGSEGLQFEPQMSEDQSITKFDERVSRPVHYKFKSESNHGKIDVNHYEVDPINTNINADEAKIFNTENNGFFNVGHHYNLPLLVSKSGFEGCEMEGQNPIIDGSEQLPTGDNFLKMEPVTGFTVDTAESLYLSTFLKAGHLSFPGIQTTGFFPILQIDSRVTIPEDVFSEKFTFVAPSSSKKNMVRYFMYPIAGIFLLLSVALYFWYRGSDKNTPVQYARINQTVTTPKALNNSSPDNQEPLMDNSNRMQPVEKDAPDFNRIHYDNDVAKGNAAML
jgi:hypothetical protein